jgi:hypothetical protein
MGIAREHFPALKRTNFPNNRHRFRAVSNGQKDPGSTVCVQLPRKYKMAKGLATRHKRAANAQYDHWYIVPHECTMLLSYLWTTDPIDLVLVNNMKGEVV